MNTPAMIQTLPLKALKPNPNNPRVIRDAKFQQLVESIKSFPDMLYKRPIVVDEDHVVLGGNMRLKALEVLKYKEVPVIVADGWTDDQKKEFLVKDNVSFGEWDWDVLANEWDGLALNEWGLNVWVPEAEPDYTVLDAEEFSGLDEQTDEYHSATTRGIVIQFLPDQYEEAYELYKEWVANGRDVGAAVLQLLRG